MRSFISEDDIEQAILQKLSAAPFNYDILRCNPTPEAQNVLPDGTGRSNKKQCALPEVLKASLLRINPTIPEEKIDTAVRELCRDFTGSIMTAVKHVHLNWITPFQMGVR